MYKDEIKRLKKHKQTHEQIDIPNDLIDERIRTGLKKAKLEEKQPFRMNWLLAVALLAIILVGFVSTKHIIDYIRDNKGLISAIEHDYYEEINIATKIDDVEFIIDGVIADKKGIVIFYTIHSDEKRDRMELRDVQLEDNKGIELNLQSTVYGGDMLNIKKNKSFSGMIEAFYKDYNELTDFNIVAEVIGSSSDGTIEGSFNDTFSIPFSIENDLSPSIEYILNETVIIEGQKITFLSASISPLRTEIHVLTDPENTKKILNFDDLRIVDEHGESWGTILNGVTAISLFEGDQTIYLQSNYFTDPTELYIELNKIQAVDRAESKVVVDPTSEKIIKQPKGNLLKKFRVETGYLVFEMDEKDMGEHHGFGFSNMFNEDGEEISYSSSYFRQKEDSIEVGVAVDYFDDLNGFISLEIAHYPLWITGNERIRLK